MIDDVRNENRGKLIACIDLVRAAWGTLSEHMYSLTDTKAAGQLYAHSKQGMELAERLTDPTTDDANEDPAAMAVASFQGIAIGALQLRDAYLAEDDGKTAAAADVLKTAVPMLAETRAQLLAAWGWPDEV